MLREDFVIQSNIRRILVRSNVDYSELTFGTVRGVVYIRGVFKVAGMYKGEDTQYTKEFEMQTLRSLEKKIRSIREVVDVIFEFVNWKKEKGQWIPKKEKED